MALAVCVLILLLIEKEKKKGHIKIFCSILLKYMSICGKAAYVFFFSRKKDDNWISQDFDKFTRSIGK
jgi:hypothetical protein